MPVCWLSLDPLDQDPQRFFAYLIAAVAERFPAFGKRSNSVLRSVTSLEQDSERLLTSLVNELGDRIDQHFVLVVDDYQFIDFIPPIRDLFSRFISQSGENCHVILATRRLPTLPNIAQMVARQQVSGFDLEELAFRPAEIRALFEQNYGFRMTAEVADELARQTEGWITGLILSADEVRREAPDPATAALWAGRMRAARSSGVDLAVYLDGQVLSPQPPEVRQFLLETSLLEEFDLELCRQVLGRRQLEAPARNGAQQQPLRPGGGTPGEMAALPPSLRRLPARAHAPGIPRAGESHPCPPGAGVRARRRAGKSLRPRPPDWQPAGPGRPGGAAGRPGCCSGSSLITLQSWLEEIPAALMDKRPALLSLKGAFLCGLGDGPAAVPLLDRTIGTASKGGRPARAGAGFRTPRRRPPPGGRLRRGGGRYARKPCAWQNPCPVWSTSVPKLYGSRASACSAWGRRSRRSSPWKIPCSA